MEAAATPAPVRSARGLPAAAFALTALLCAAPAAAHEGVPSDRAILQFRPDATEMLYEAAFPAGPDAARWRFTFDTDHDGRLSDAEQGALTEGVGNAVRARVRLRLEGGEIPLRLLDARLTTQTGAGMQGRFAAAVLLGTREVPPGTRKVELEIDPLVDRSRPVLVRLETERAKIASVVGGGSADDRGVPMVLLRKGQRCTIVLDVPPAPPPAPQSEARAQPARKDKARPPKGQLAPRKGAAPRRSPDLERRPPRE